MSRRRPKGKYMLGIIAMLLVILVALERVSVKKHRDKPFLNKKDTTFRYRTVSAADSSQKLFPYEFHKGEGNGSNHVACSAIIRTIDPAKDDYKTYCRSVIADIVKTTGIDDVEISIYDDYEAYELSEVKFSKQMKALTENESDTINKHSIADYKGVIRGFDKMHTLSFYPEVHNRYTETESYEPEK